jgi:hypothetical protein
MRLILLVSVLSACAAGNRTTRVLDDAEYVAFADRPSGGYAPMAPPDCAGSAPECAGQWLAQVHIGDRGGAIERVLQTRAGFQIYVRAKQACDGDPEPNWQLLLRKPVVPINVVQLGKAPACETSRR